MRRTFCLAVALLALGSLACGQNSVFRHDPLWKYHVPGKVNIMESVGNRTLVGAENGAYLMDYGGKIVWFHPTGGSVTSIRPYEDKVLVASSDGLLKLLFGNGTVIWERTVPGYVGYNDAVAADRRGIVAGSMDGYVYMLDGNGSYMWKHLVGSFVTGAYLLADRVVAVSDRQVYVLDVDGTVRLNLDISGYIRQAMVSEDLIVVGTDGGYLKAYGTNGEKRWEEKLGEYISVVDGNGNVTVGTREQHLFSYGENGKLRWKLNMTDGVVALKSTDDMVVVGTKDNKVFIYSSDGSLRWFYPTEGRASAIAVDNGNVLSGTTDGWIYYSKLPRRDMLGSFVIAVAVVVVVTAALTMVSRSWK